MTFWRWLGSLHLPRPMVFLSPAARALRVHNFLNSRGCGPERGRDPVKPPSVSFSKGQVLLVSPSRVPAQTRPLLAPTSLPQALTLLASLCRVGEGSMGSG